MSEKSFKYVTLATFWSFLGIAALSVVWCLAQVMMNSEISADGYKRVNNWSCHYTGPLIEKALQDGEINRWEFAEIGDAYRSNMGDKAWLLRKYGDK
jgi:hypothetical protein